MILPSLPARKQVFRELSPLSTMLYETFPEIASDTVIPYFADRGRAIDQRLATDMLRYEILYALNSLGVYAEYDDGLAAQDAPSVVDLKQIQNNGIEGIFGGWRFKLLRSRSGAVPPPGRSEQRKQYYAQRPPPSQQLALYGLGEHRPSPLRPNAVILWDFDDGYKQVQIRIAIPQGFSGEFGAVRCYFNDLVPHPVEVTSKRSVAVNNPMDDDDHGELEVTWKEPGEVRSEGHSIESRLSNSET